MFNISSFLSKISKNISNTDDLRKSICESVYKNTNIEIKLEDLVIKNNIVYMEISPTYKNKIFIKKNNIIEEILLSTNINIIDIR